MGFGSHHARISPATQGQEITAATRRACRTKQPSLSAPGIHSNERHGQPASQGTRRLSVQTVGTRLVGGQVLLVVRVPPHRHEQSALRSKIGALSRHSETG